MKKNLKIVSAAAALLAVAPVVATGVAASPVVNAAANTDISINGTAPAITGDVMLSSHLTATTTPHTTTTVTRNGKTTTTYSDWDGKISGNVTATLNGQSYTMNLPLATSSRHQVILWQLRSKSDAHAVKVNGQVDPSNGVNYVTVKQYANGQYIIKPGVQYFVSVAHASFNFGAANANRTNLTVASNDGIRFHKSVNTGNNNGNSWVDRATFNTNQNGTTSNFFSVMIPVKATQTNGQATDNTDYSNPVRVWNRKASYIYNANHEKQGLGYMYKIGSGHNVVRDSNGQPREYHLANGFNAYRLADGHYKGNYVDVRNFQTSRVENNVKIVTTRSRVFTANGNVVGKHNYVNAGVRVRTSGTKTIKGHKMYRIATNRYIKAANVRNA